MGKHFKVLTLSLLALVSVLALSASAAQANWLLLKNGTSVLLLNIEGSSSEDLELLVLNGIQVHCSSSEGTADILLSPDHRTLTGSVTGTFHGCFELSFGDVCETHSLGQPDGTIVASFGGVGGMVSAEEVYLESPNLSELLTTITFTGPECPLGELDDHLKGHVRITALTALQNQSSHVVHTNATNLTLGDEGAQIDNETGGHVILGTGSIAGATFASHLIGL